MMSESTGALSHKGFVVVTGAAGMIGSQISQALAHQGYPIVACDVAHDDGRPDYLAGIRVAHWLSADALPGWLDANAECVSAIVHMGAISDTTETRLELLAANNVDFSLALWRRACRHDWRFLYASSAATYGDGGQGFADRDDLAFLGRLTPLNPYGASKHQVDVRIMEDCAAGLPTPRVWAGFKFFNVYGPNEEHKGAMRSLVRKIVPTILAGEPVRLFRSHRPDFADGAQSRDFIYVKDAIRPVLRALGVSDLSGLFNVGTGTARSFYDLALATYSALGASPRIDFVDMPTAIQGQYQYHTRAEITKAEAHGLQAVRYSLEEGVADYVAQLTAGTVDLTNAAP